MALLRVSIATLVLGGILAATQWLVPAILPWLIGWMFANTVLNLYEFAERSPQP